LSLALKRQAFFMISGPILEELLLSQKAVYRNVSVGGAGLVQIVVPEGKTWIITKIHILPFLNIITPLEEFAIAATFDSECQQTLRGILERIQYQLLFYTPRLNSVYNVRNKFGLSLTENNTPETVTRPFLEVTDQFFECFHMVGDNFYLFLKYFNFNQADEWVIDQYSAIFNGSQNWPPTTPYGYNNSMIDVGIYTFPYGTFPDYYFYQPQSQSGTIPLQNEFLLPTQTVFTGSEVNRSFIPPTVPGQNFINANELPSVPFYNLSVIEINKRLTTNGIL
jgi:hypothetical protein